MLELAVRNLIVLGAFLLCATSATAQSSTNFCITEYLKGSTTLGIAPSDASTLIREVARSIGVQPSVTVIPCRFEEKAAAVEHDGQYPGIPAGQYVVYSPEWVREVIGNDRIQAIALFGHEFGHLINRHDTLSKNLSRLEKETQADEFAGCAVARLGGSWDALSGLLSRLRSDGNQDGRYPGRLKSLQAAEQGFVNCGGTRPQRPAAPAIVVNPSGVPGASTEQKDCANLAEGSVHVRLMPQLSNFGRNELTRLEKLIDCRGFHYSIGKGRFPGQAMNAVAYSGVLDHRVLAKLLSGLRQMNAEPEFICNDLTNLKDEYVLLAHYSYGEEGSLSKSEISRLIAARSQSEYDGVLRTHVCRGPWPIRGEAAKLAARE